MWISFLIVTTALSLILGYVVTYMVMDNEYSFEFTWVFLMEGVLLIVPCAVLLAIFKPEYYS